MKDDQEPELTYDGYAAVEDEEKNEGLSADSSSSTAKPKAVLVPRSDRTAWADVNSDGTSEADKNEDIPPEGPLREWQDPGSDDD